MYGSQSTHADCFAVVCYVMLGHGTFRPLGFISLSSVTSCSLIALPRPAPPRPAPPRPAKIHAEMNLHHLQEAAAKPLCENSWQDNKNVLADRFKPIQQDVTIPWTPHIFLLRDTNPLHVRGKAANLEDRTIRFFYRSENLFCFVLQIGCIPMMCKGSIEDSDNHWSSPMLYGLQSVFGNSCLGEVLKHTLY